LARFVALKGLKEVGHGYDTNCNESFNNVVAWLAPKNKVYSTTDSLKNRVAVALGVNGMRHDAYFHHMFECLGIKMTPDVAHCIKVVHGKRERRSTISKTSEYKKKRQKAFHKKLKQHSEVAKKEKAKREGLVYRPGIGMDDGYISDTNVEDEKKQQKLEKKEQQQTAKQSTRKPPRCSACGKIGHNKSNPNCQKKRSRRRKATARAVGII